MGRSLGERGLFAPSWDDQRVLIWLLVILTSVRLAAAALIPLAPDEAYYWVWSRDLQPGYLDHPPMVALWIRAGTALVGAAPLGVRLLGPLSAALGSCLLFDAANRMFPGRSCGLTAVLLLNATLILGVGAVIMTPDTPLLFFWTAALWAAVRTSGGPRWWLAVGAFAGGALLSKYTAILLPAGLGVFVLVSRSRDLRTVWPFLGLALSGLLFLPVVVWNADHGWASFLKQGGRATDWQPARAAGFIAELVLGQIALATPLVLLLMAAGSVAAARLAWRSRGPHETLLTALIMPPALLFLQHAVGGRVQGNWPAIIYPAAAIAGAALPGPKWRRPAWSLGFILSGAVYVLAITGWSPLPASRDPLARQLKGWAGLTAAADLARFAAGADFIAVEPYSTAAELAWFAPKSLIVLGAGSHWDTSGFPRGPTPVGPGLLIRPERYGEGVDEAVWPDAIALETLTRPGGGERYRVFLVRLAPGSPAGVWLPRR